MSLSSFGHLSGRLSYPSSPSSFSSELFLYAEEAVEVPEEEVSLNLRQKRQTSVDWDGLFARVEAGEFLDVAPSAGEGW